jgi:DNA-binding NarL/FixJ family response regulator
MPLRLLLVDDDHNFRSALSALIAAMPEVQLVGEAADAESAIQLTQELVPDVVLIDWQLPGMDGIEATRHIREAHPDLAVLILSGSADGRMRQAAKAAGVAAVIDKGTGLESLGSEISAAAARRSGRS